MNGNELLAYLAPPTDLINHLERSFADRQQKGQPTPESCLQWLARWQQIRSDGKTAIDGATPAQWQQAAEIVREKVTA